MQYDFSFLEHEVLSFRLKFNFSVNCFGPIVDSSVAAFLREIFQSTPYMLGLDVQFVW